VRIERAMRPGLTFMTFHHQDEIAVNLLTIDATDPKSGTAEFKATAIRIEKLVAGEDRASGGGIVAGGKRTASAVAEG
jgi:formate dehydrogenase major subunit